MKKENDVRWTGLFMGILMIVIGILFEKLLIVFGVLVIASSFIVKIMVERELKNRMS
ncbi:hypothetical protein LJC58_05100 [Lachnospiraceae bacterium OttesenSCG-928-D06]|nr:hypothetical protein [Lachnospiraceae bacterium OttesenSCG-928-D06]